MTFINKNPLTITIGADSKVTRIQKHKKLFEANQINTKPAGYCGTCKTRYDGNYTKHECGRKNYEAY